MPEGKSMTVRADQVQRGDVLKDSTGNRMVVGRPTTTAGNTAIRLAAGRTDPGTSYNYAAGTMVNIWRPNH